jgi:peptide/nickel transport system ATP-binding protein
MEKEIVLSVNGLSVAFRMYGKGVTRKELRVISNLNINVRKGEIIAVAGSSGSGKSLLAHAILGILPGNAVVSGEINYCGTPLTEPRLRKLRGKEIALVPQSVEYLDPLMKVGKQVSADKAAVKAAFERYKLADSAANLFPFQLSGGMMRRVLCATAVVGNAKLIIADEPTPGMSKDLAGRAMKHFRDLADAGAAVVLITHDIDLALGYADRIAVFYAGTTVETALASDFTDESLLRHPYTKALWRAMPGNGFRPTAGIQPYAGSLPEGCLFAPRCDKKTQECTYGIIEPREVRNGEVCCRYAS